MPGTTNFTGKRHEIIGYTAGVDAKEMIVVKVEDNAHTVYLDGCKGTAKDGQIVIKIEGKFNALTINNCQRAGIVFDSGVSTVEIINSKKLMVQVTGTMNNWQVDKSEEINLFINEASRDAIHILSSQTEAFNVTVSTDAENQKEFGFPEQIQSLWKDGKFVHKVFENEQE
eukprot:TRINITY_DN15482_c0_g1_i1.p1 TRINITY_DN15482_c0_g1~~TRINITY_DN15482_c0_g1_i1.p1  ORF type:complete len:183 (-),score=78.16 TRINITY_DN15482_c0_g1_i1:175-687(-)